MTEHTPGPWMVTPDHDEGIGWRHVSSFPEGFGDIATTWSGKHGDASEANARLIAAAPDMLDALEELVDTLDSRGVIDSFTTQSARAAIAKATGKTR